jgi:hypothetical protein
MVSITLTIPALSRRSIRAWQIGRSDVLHRGRLVCVSSPVARIRLLARRQLSAGSDIWSVESAITTVLFRPLPSASCVPSIAKSARPFATSGECPYRILSLNESGTSVFDPESPFSGAMASAGTLSAMKARRLEDSRRRRRHRRLAPFRPGRVPCTSDRLCVSGHPSDALRQGHELPQISA